MTSGIDPHSPLGQVALLADENRNPFTVRLAAWAVTLVDLSDPRAALDVVRDTHDLMYSVLMTFGQLQTRCKLSFSETGITVDNTYIRAVATKAPACLGGKEPWQLDISNLKFTMLFFKAVYGRVSLNSAQKESFDAIIDDAKAGLARLRETYTGQDASLLCAEKTSQKDIVETASRDLEAVERYINHNYSIIFPDNRSPIEELHNRVSQGRCTAPLTLALEIAATPFGSLLPEREENEDGSEAATDLYATLRTMREALRMQWTENQNYIDSLLVAEWLFARNDGEAERLTELSGALAGIRNMVDTARVEQITLLDGSGLFPLLHDVLSGTGERRAALDQSQLLVHAAGPKGVHVSPAVGKAARVVAAVLRQGLPVARRLKQANLAEIMLSLISEEDNPDVAGVQQLAAAITAALAAQQDQSGAELVSATRDVTAIAARPFLPPSAGDSTTAECHALYARIQGCSDDELARFTELVTGIEGVADADQAQISSLLPLAQSGTIDTATFANMLKVYTAEEDGPAFAAVVTALSAAEDEAA